MTKQGNSSGYQGNAENNNGDYGPDCFGKRGNLFRPLPLSVGRFTRSVPIRRTLVIVSVAHLFVLYNNLLPFQLIIDTFLKAVIMRGFSLTELEYSEPLNSLTKRDRWVRFSDRRLPSEREYTPDSLSQYPVRILEDCSKTLSGLRSLTQIIPETTGRIEGSVMHDNSVNTLLGFNRLESLRVPLVLL